MIPIDPGNLRDFIIACVILASLWGGIRFVAHRSEPRSRGASSRSERPGQSATPKPPPLTAGKKKKTTFCCCYIFKPQKNPHPRYPPRPGCLVGGYPLSPLARA